MESVVRGTVLQSGELAFVGELQTNDSEGRSVRVVGRIFSLDFAHSRCTVSHRGQSLLVDTSLLEALPFRLNALVSLIGEVAVDESGIILRARVCSSVDGLSVDMWDKSVIMHRLYMTKLDEKDIL